jgi:hypothetical protein
MVKRILVLIGIICSVHLSAQTGIGTTTPNASAKLDVYSDNKGFLPPRVSLTGAYDRTTIPSPATGLLVYSKGDAGLAAGYYYWNGNAWATIATEGGSGSFAASFLRGSRSTAQTTGLSSDGTIVFTQTDISSGNDISLNTSTGQITLAAGKTYRLLAQVPNYQNSNSYSLPQFSWYNESSGSYIGSSSSSYAPMTTAAYGATGGLSEVILTTTSTTIVSYRIVQISAVNQLGGSIDFSASGSYPWFEAQVISGNAPVTGQSVDYVSVTRTTTQSVVAGDKILFDQINGGNIPYNSSTGNFTLTAGKTYRMTGYISLANNNASAEEVNVAWKTAAGDVLSNKGELLSTNFGTTAAAVGVADVIFTPSTNTTVSLSVLYTSSGVILWGNFTYANIQQIGSSAIVNPWVLSGNDVYNTTGKVGIGTNAPDASAILDVSSSSKGLLPPRVALTARNGTSSPISSPTTGLFVYNTATAGTAANAVSPGFYFYNGTVWTRMDPEEWSTPVAITVGAVTTAPTKGTIVYDKVSYRRTSTTSYEVTYNYAQSAPGTAGSGDYLFSLPAGLSFGSSVLKTNSTVYETVINRAIIGTGILAATDANRFRAIAIVPYDSTKFRLVVTSSDNTGQIIDSATLGLNFDGISYKFSFILDTN